MSDNFINPFTCPYIHNKMVPLITTATTCIHQMVLKSLVIINGGKWALFICTSSLPREFTPFRILKKKKKKKKIPHLSHVSKYDHTLQRILTRIRRRSKPVFLTPNTCTIKQPMPQLVCISE